MEALSAAKAGPLSRLLRTGSIQAYQGKYFAYDPGPSGGKQGFTAKERSRLRNPPSRSPQLPSGHSSVPVLPVGLQRAQ